MIDTGVPYFMTNESWYYYDNKEGIYKLTDLAPTEAIQSYKEFYSENDIIFN